MNGVRKLRFLSRVWLVALFLGLTSWAAAQTMELTIWRIPTANSLPYGIALAPDGKVYFTEFFANKLGQLDPGANEIRERAVGAGPGGLFWTRKVGYF